MPLFGQNGMKIDVSGVFSIMPAILFGPMYGALVSGLADFVGYFLKPTGPYLPLMTLIIAAGGFIRGAMWLALRGKSGKNMRICVAAVSIILLLSGVSNLIFLNADGVNSHFYENSGLQNADITNMRPISRMLIERTSGAKNPANSLSAYRALMTSGLIGTAAFGIILIAADILISKRFYKHIREGEAMRLLLAILVSGLIVTTLNTLLLRETIYTSWKALPFAVVWIPRVIEEALSGTVYAYITALLLGIFESQPRLRGLIKEISV